MYILGGIEPPVLSERAVLGKHNPMAAESPSGWELRLLVLAWLDIRAPRPRRHSRPWKHFLSVFFSWSWQESGALITCLGEASFRLMQAKGFGKHLLGLVGQFLALAGVLVGMLEAQAESGWEAQVGIPAPARISASEVRLHSTQPALSISCWRSHCLSSPCSCAGPPLWWDSFFSRLSLPGCPRRKGQGMHAGREARCSSVPPWLPFPLCVQQQTRAGFAAPVCLFSACPRALPERSCMDSRRQWGLQEP